MHSCYREKQENTFPGVPGHEMAALTHNKSLIRLTNMHFGPLRHRRVTHTSHSSHSCNIVGTTGVERTGMSAAVYLCFFKALLVY